MIIPVRCMSCGKPVSALWEKFKQKSDGTNTKQVLDELGVERYCCRTLLMTHVDRLHDVAKFRS